MAYVGQGRHWRGRTRAVLRGNRESEIQRRRNRRSKTYREVEMRNHKENKQSQNINLFKNEIK